MKEAEMEDENGGRRLRSNKENNIVNVVNCILKNIGQF